MGEQEHPSRCFKLFEIPYSHFATNMCFTSEHGNQNSDLVWELVINIFIQNWTRSQDSIFFSNKEVSNCSEAARVLIAQKLNRTQNVQFPENPKQQLFGRGYRFARKSTCKCFDAACVWIQALLFARGLLRGNLHPVWTGPFVWKNLLSKLSKTRGLCFDGRKSSSGETTEAE